MACERCAQHRQVIRHMGVVHRLCATPLLHMSPCRPGRCHAHLGTIGDEVGARTCAHLSSITILLNAVKSYEKTYDTANAAKGSPR